MDALAGEPRRTRTPGEPGVRLRCSLDLRQELPAVARPTKKPTTV
ncbi:DUF6207 family protein [Streptomyces sp. NPDC049915]